MTIGSTDPLPLLALRLARACRQVVQGCLREEEWADADGEFYDIILSGLKELADGSGDHNPAGADRGGAGGV